MTAAKVFTYSYAYVREIWDGDTFHCDIDLGMHMWLMDRRVRLLGINCPELDTDEGVTAKEYAQTILQPGDVVRLVSSRLDQYGRIYADVFTPRLPNMSVSAAMLLAGHAVVDK